jgi:hypothetical protein
VGDDLRALEELIAPDVVVAIFMSIGRSIGLSQNE